MDDKAAVLGPGLVLGAGLGGLVDGIVFHQILQWHHLLGERRHDPVVQLVADGVFQAVAWIAVLLGVVWLWHRIRTARRPQWLTLVGPILAGWGMFNVLEGLVNHHLLGVHHVRAGQAQLWYDLAFLAVGAALVLAGLTLHGRASSGRDRTGRARR